MPSLLALIYILRKEELSMSKIAIFFENHNPVYDFSKAKDDKEKAELAKSFAMRLFGVTYGDKSISWDDILNAMYDAAAMHDAAAVTETDGGAVLDVTKILEFLAEEIIPALKEQVVKAGTRYVEVGFVGDNPRFRFASAEEVEGD
jgi:hypothetical protein